MVAIVTRAGKGSPLTNTEVDSNFINLNNGKVENTQAGILAALGYTPLNAAGGTLTGQLINSGYSTASFSQNGSTQSGYVSQFLLNGTVWADNGATASTLYGVLSQPLISNSGASGANQTSAVGGYFIPQVVSSGASGSIAVTGLLGVGERTNAADSSTSSTLTGGQFTGRMAHTVASTATASTVRGIFGNAIINGGAATEAQGVASTGNVGTNTSVTNTVSVTNYYQFYGAPVFVGTTSASYGTITNLYGLYLAAPSINTRGTVTNRWGIYQADSSAANYFAGSMNVVGSLSQNGNSVLTTASTYSGTLTSSQVTTALGYTPYQAATATSTVNGLIELGSDTVQSVAANAVTATASRTYALQLNASGQAVVNVPWTDTNSGGTVTSVSGTGTVSGLTLTGTVTGSGSLTLGGTLSLTSANVTTALGYTPYNSTNPNGYITSSALSSYAALSGATFTGDITTYRSGSPTTGVIYLGNSGSRYLYFDGSNYFMPNGQLDVNGSRVLNAGNYTSYSPSLTGSGASGTWGINITGSAVVAIRNTIDTAPAVVMNSDGTFYGHVARRTTQQWGMGWGNGVGAATNFGIYYDTSGNFTATGNVTAFSDERLKQNWRDLPEDFVEQLALVKHGIYDRTDSAITQVGVSAQSLRNPLPNAVDEDVLTGTLSVNYGNAALVSAIALSKQVVELKKQIKSVQEKLGA